VGLFEHWLDYKAKQVEKRSLEKQQSFAGHLRQFFKTKDAVLISEDETFKFRDWLLKRNKPITVRERIDWLRSYWKWGIKRKLLVSDTAILIMTFSLPQL
jgi:integrase